MKNKIPKELLRTRYRKEMWNNAQRILKKLEKTLPIESAYLLGSFTTPKKRPADVDVLLLLHLKEPKQKAAWSLDLVLTPNNTYGAFVLEDAKKWMKQKYGTKKSAVLRLK